MPAPRRQFQRDEPLSLRKGGSAATFTDEQLLTVAVFTTALLQGGYAAYLKLNESGNSLRLKIYGEKDSWQDNITNQEDLTYLLDDYATQLKVVPVFRGLMGALHAATAPEAPSGPPAGKPVPQGAK